MTDDARKTGKQPILKRIRTLKTPSDVRRTLRNIMNAVIAGEIPSQTAGTLNNSCAVALKAIEVETLARIETRLEEADRELDKRVIEGQVAPARRPLSLVHDAS